MRARIEGEGIATDAGDALPLTLETCLALRERYGDQLVVDAGLSAWALAERRRRRQSPVAALAPALAAAMANRPYQITGARIIAERGNVAVLDEGGLGKTAQAFAGLMESGNWRGRHLVVCPKTAITSTWAEEIRRWTDGQVFTAVAPAARKLAAIEDFLAAETGARFLITNPETLRTTMRRFCPKCDRWVDAAPKVIPEQHVGQDHKTPWKIYRQECPQLFGVEFDSIICDEADRYMLGLRPQTGKMTLWGEGLVRLQGRQKIAMTGTPFRGKESNVFGILHWLDPVRFSSFWKFINAYFVQEDNGFGVEIGGILPERADDFAELLDRYSIRRTRAEVRDDLPENLSITHWVEMPPEHRKQYTAMEEDGYIRLGADVLQGLGVLSELTRLKQMAFGSMDYRASHIEPKVSPKYDLLVDMLAARGVTTTGPTFGVMKYIVASQFTEQLDWIESRLNASRIETLKITGAVTGRARDAAVAAFSAPGGARVLLLNTAVASSITLDAWCDEMFILDETFVEDDQVQLRWRIDNRGARIAVRVFHYLRTRGTIDERIAEDNLSQAAMQDQLLDGRRGLEVARRLLGRTG